MRILITGGAGFVGAGLARAFKRDNPGASVVAFDNLKRRGSELNLPLLKQHGIDFVHGDIRNTADLEDLDGNFDLLIEASAEPSVLAGLNGSPRYVLQTNLAGTLNCLEFARQRAPRVIFLSTSRVYSIEPLRALKLRETAQRFELEAAQDLPGASSNGIAENFATDRARSIYGASKLASELIVQEYAHAYKMQAVINRCGVIAGPGQFGKVDQGVFTFWVANHFFKKPLAYTGFGGSGKQVRDVLHPRDLYALLKTQNAVLDKCSGEIFNIGGGREISASLAEMTALCREITGNSVPVASHADSSAVDIPLYLSDCTKAARAFGWKPSLSARDIVLETASWLKENAAQLAAVFG
jgi:CDP-paratose 2-epimerase